MRFYPLTPVERFPCSSYDDIFIRHSYFRELPPRTDGHDWILKFSTSQDGFTLNSLMRKLAKVEGPVVLIMSDIPGAVFGAFLSHAPKFSEHFEVIRFKSCIAQLKHTLTIIQFQCRCFNTLYMCSKMDHFGLINR
jgi:hypothetical protein